MIMWNSERWRRWRVGKAREGRERGLEGTEVEKEGLKKCRTKGNREEKERLARSETTQRVGKKGERRRDMMIMEEGKGRREGREEEG